MLYFHLPVAHETNGSTRALSGRIAFSKIGVSLNKPHTSEIAVLIVTSLVCYALYAMGVNDNNGRTVQ